MCEHSDLRNRLMHLRHSARREHGELRSKMAQAHGPVHAGDALVRKDDGGAVALVPVPWPLGDSARK